MEIDEKLRKFRQESSNKPSTSNSTENKSSQSLFDRIKGLFLFPSNSQQPKKQDTEKIAVKENDDSHVVSQSRK